MTWNALLDTVTTCRSFARALPVCLVLTITALVVSGISFDTLAFCLRHALQAAVTEFSLGLERGPTAFPRDRLACAGNIWRKGESP